MSWNDRPVRCPGKKLFSARTDGSDEKLLNADLTLKGVLPGGDSPQAVIQRLVVELC